MSARFVDWATLRSGVHPAFLTLVEVQYRDGNRERYVLPLAMAGGPEAETILQQHGTAVLARISGARKGLLFDGLFDDGVCARLLDVLEHGYEIRMRHGRVGSRPFLFVPNPVTPRVSGWKDGGTGCPAYFTSSGFGSNRST